MTDKLTLSELQLVIKDSLYLAMPDSFWVIAEISEIKVNFAGHCYLELIEKRPEEKDIKARVKAIIWSNRYRFLNSFFESTTGESLREGMKILVKAKVDYHELYGLSLQISDIDPSFTLGEMALTRQMVIKRLESEGVFLMNKELDFPAVPQKIAVISSKHAAGYEDFINHLKSNGSGYIFHIALFETVMQGRETEQSVIGSLNRIADYPGLFDVVVIIRGGGSQTDLSWFDSYNIAFYVTQFPIPVLTGIGHEKDLSVTDLVAFQSLKTPTAVADFIIGCVADTEERLKKLSADITGNAQQAIDEYGKQLDSLRSNLVPFARLLLATQKEKLSVRIFSIINISKEFLSKAGLIPEKERSGLIRASGLLLGQTENSVDRFRLDLISITSNSLARIRNITDAHENSLTMLNPENVLKRGYTITTLDGKIVKSTKQIKIGDIIDTQFRDGAIKSYIFEKNNLG